MRMSRPTGALSGALLVLLGIWGGMIPFVGPYFDYSFGVNSTWDYTTDRLWLCIIPAAVAVLAGLLLLMARTRGAGILAGWLAVAAGAWFVVGPAVSLTWESGPGPIGAPLFGTTRQMLELIGYFYALGALMVALGAFVIGCFAGRPRLAADRGAVAGFEPRETPARRPAAAPAEAPAAAGATAAAMPPPRTAAPPETAPTAAPVTTVPGATTTQAASAPPPIPPPAQAPAPAPAAEAQPARRHPRFPLSRRRGGARRSGGEQVQQR